MGYGTTTSPRGGCCYGRQMLQMHTLMYNVPAVNRHDSHDMGHGRIDNRKNNNSNTKLGDIPSTVVVYHDANNNNDTDDNSKYQGVLNLIEESDAADADSIVLAKKMMKKKTSKKTKPYNDDDNHHHHDIGDEVIIRITDPEDDEVNVEQTNSGTSSSGSGSNDMVVEKSFVGFTFTTDSNASSTTAAAATTTKSSPSQQRISSSCCWCSSSKTSTMMNMAVPRRVSDDSMLKIVGAARHLDDDDDDDNKDDDGMHSGINCSCSINNNVDSDDAVFIPVQDYPVEFLELMRDPIMEEPSFVHRPDPSTLMDPTAGGGGGGDICKTTSYGLCYSDSKQDQVIKTTTMKMRVENGSNVVRPHLSDALLKSKISRRLLLVNNQGSNTMRVSQNNHNIQRQDPHAHAQPLLFCHSFSSSEAAHTSRQSLLAAMTATTTTATYQNTPTCNSHLPPKHVDHNKTGLGRPGRKRKQDEYQQRHKRRRELEKKPEFRSMPALSAFSTYTGMTGRRGPYHQW